MKGKFSEDTQQRAEGMFPSPGERVPGRKSSMSKWPVAGGCRGCLKNEDNVVGGLGNYGEGLRLGEARCKTRWDLIHQKECSASIR